MMITCEILLEPSTFPVAILKIYFLVTPPSLVSVGILERSIGARNQVEIGSYRPATLQIKDQ